MNLIERDLAVLEAERELKDCVRRQRIAWILPLALFIADSWSFALMAIVGPNSVASSVLVWVFTVPAFFLWIGLTVRYFVLTGDYNNEISHAQVRLDDARRRAGR